MSSSGIKQRDLPLATRVECSAETLTVELSDGRTMSVPLDWYPRLKHGRDDADG